MNGKKAKALRRKLRFKPSAERPMEGIVYQDPEGNMNTTIRNRPMSLRSLYQYAKRQANKGS